MLFKKFSASSLCPHSAQPKARGSTIIDGSQCWLQIRIQETFGTSISDVWPLDQDYWYQETQNFRHIQAHLIRIDIVVRSLDNLHTHWSLRCAIQYHAKGQENLHFWRFWFICSWEEPRHHLKKSTSNLQLIRVDCGAKFDNQWLGISHS